MAHNTSITLGDHFQQLSSHLIEGGRYNNVSEVVRAGLRLLEEHEEHRETLRQAIQDGLDSGIAADFDEEDFLMRMRAKHGVKT